MPFNYPCALSPSPPPVHCDNCWEGACRHAVHPNFFGHTEPEIVYNLFFAPPAVQAWQNRFSSFRPPVSYGGVFVHQKPYVSFGGKSCELADLLIVFTDHNAQRRTAVLFQAKIGGRWRPANNKQWELLTTWPPIEYTPGSSGSVCRTMPFSGSADPGGKYMLLNKPSLEVDTAPAQPLKSLSGVAQELLSVLNGTSGRPFAWDRASARDDWDHLIWDLIDHTAHTAAGIAKSSYPRAAGFLSLLTSGVMLPPDDDDSDFDMYDGDWGISIVQLTSQGDADRTD